MTLKEQIRVCGIDDSPFEFRRKADRVTVIGTIVRAPSYLEGVLRFDVAVDGDDSTDMITRAIASSRFNEQIRAVMLDGITLGGFNIVDIDRLHAEIDIPVITVTRDAPDTASIERALRKHFEDWGTRFEVISRMKTVEMGTGHKPIHVGFSGIDEDEVRELIRQTTVRGVVPEPLRMAHIIASGVERGESRGKA